MSGSPSPIEANILRQKEIYTGILEERDSLLREAKELRAKLSKTERERDEFRKKCTDLQLGMLLSSSTRDRSAVQEEQNQSTAGASLREALKARRDTRPEPARSTGVLALSARPNPSRFEGVFPPNRTLPRQFMDLTVPAKQTSNSLKLSKRAFEQSNTDRTSTENPEKKLKTSISPGRKNETSPSPPSSSSPLNSGVAGLPPGPIASKDRKPVKKQDVDDIAGREDVRCIQRAPSVENNLSELTELSPGGSEGDDIMGERSGEDEITYGSDEVDQIQVKYLRDIPEFPITPAPPRISVSRAFLSKEYGGHNAQLISHMNKSRSKENPAMFPSWDYNQYLPPFKGAPGLMFSPRRDVLGPCWRLFVANRGKPVTHNYMGDYKTTCVGHLTVKEFTNLKDKVQDSLVGVAYKTTYDECQAIRVRVQMRKNGTLPADPGNIEREVMSRVQNRHQANVYRGLGLTKDDVRDAFLRGEEVFQVILMECIGYNHAFGQDLLDKWPHFAPEPRKSRAKKASQ
ncbi:hypothetical protein FIBSPDRAFT_933649 [Athelia psychrophila]|uniref:DUF6697 domain-containing protein n=1 Tax=Athelia psychrophila TaxID=1759441 RepID=A0A166GVB6_9AGAM|nr:hypothetical protein FIBSPDRAFT_933649 [Fibularhizoctonia sp. CBS 109695]